MAKTHGGKGSEARPFSVSQKQFEENWDRIFKKDWSVDDAHETFGNIKKKIDTAKDDLEF